MEDGTASFTHTHTHTHTHSSMQAWSLLKHPSIHSTFSEISYKITKKKQK